MAPREDLISSAVTFLQDPSVASSSLEKRIEFLQSKNLTQEEIDLSLSRAGDPSSAAPTSQYGNSTYYPPPQPQSFDRRPPYNYNYVPYGDWQAPPPELPKRDWRDWFIMATVVGGAGYGLYVLTQRYIKPLIAPPTPPQLEQDKAAIDEQFARAFALLDTLSSDTAAMKEAEEARTKRLDTTLTDVEAVVTELKAANQRREIESQKMDEDIKSIKASLPKAIDSVRDGSDKRLKELSRELSSLKLLMGNRFGTNPAPTSVTGHGMSARQPADVESRSGAASPISESLNAMEREANGLNKPSNVPAYGAGTTSGYNPSSSSATQQTMLSEMSENREARARAYGGTSTAQGKAAIPAWQLAALNKEKANNAGSSSSDINGGESTNGGSVSVESEFAAQS